MWPVKHESNLVFHHGFLVLNDFAVHLGFFVFVDIATHLVFPVLSDIGIYLGGGEIVPFQHRIQSLRPRSPEL